MFTVNADCILSCGHISHFSECFLTKVNWLKVHQLNVSVFLPYLITLCKVVFPGHCVITKSKHRSSWWCTVTPHGLNHVGSLWRVWLPLVDVLGIKWLFKGRILLFSVQDVLCLLYICLLIDIFMSCCLLSTAYCIHMEISRTLFSFKALLLTKDW